MSVRSATAVRSPRATWSTSVRRSASSPPSPSEPGTQLTMRTFHTGGSASADDITQGLPRVTELFEARTPKGASPIAEAPGRVTIEDTDKGRRIILTPDNGDEPFIYPVLKRATLLIEDGQHVELGEQFIAGTVDPKEVLRSRVFVRSRSTSSTVCRTCTARRACRSTTSTSRSSCARCSARSPSSTTATPTCSRASSSTVRGTTSSTARRCRRVARPLPLARRSWASPRRPSRPSRGCPPRPSRRPHRPHAGGHGGQAGPPRRPQGERHHR